MATPSTPQNFYISQGNSNIFVAADLSAGATSYTVQRSTDGVNFSNLITGLTLPQYLDTSVTNGIQYWYQIAGVNSSGTGIFSSPLSIVSAVQGEMSLGQLRLMSQQKADRVNSNFVTKSEWNDYINLAMFELYDLLITSYEDYFMAPAARFNTDGVNFQFDLPNGTNTFTNASGQTFTPKPYYKLLGVDLSVNATSTSSFVTIKRFNFIDRNKYIYPNTNSTLYGVFNLRYRVMGNKIEFIPSPSANQTIQLWYIPRLDSLLQDQDLTTIGISGWLQYVICRAAKYALDKEESDTSKLDAELLFLKKRIEETAADRDEGQPDTISDTRNADPWGMSGLGGNFKAGW